MPDTVTDAEERPVSGKLLGQGQNTGISVGEPKRTVFEREAGVIAGRRIGDAFHATPAPDAVRVVLQALSETREVKRRAVALLTVGSCLSFT